MSHYMTVKQLSQKHPSFPEGGLRHLVFHERTNGFDSVITRVGRKVLINEQRFLEWIDNHNKGGNNV